MKAKTMIAFVVLIGGPFVGGLVIRPDPDNVVLLLVGVVIMIGSFVVAGRIAEKKPTDGDGGDG